MSASRSAAAVCTLPTGEVLVIGGYSVETGEILRSVEVFNPATGVWHSSDDDGGGGDAIIPPLTEPRAGALALLLQIDDDGPPVAPPVDPEISR